MARSRITARTKADLPSYTGYKGEILTTQDGEIYISSGNEAEGLIKLSDIVRVSTKSELPSEGQAGKIYVVDEDSDNGGNPSMHQYDKVAGAFKSFGGSSSGGASSGGGVPIYENKSAFPKPTQFGEMLFNKEDRKLYSSSIAQKSLVPNMQSKSQEGFTISSSNDGSYYPLIRAFNDSVGFAEVGASDYGTVDVHLPRAEKVYKFLVRTAKDDTQTPRIVNLLASNDGTTWTTLQANTFAAGSWANGKTEKVFEIASDKVGDYSYYRFEFKNSEYNGTFRLDQLELYHLTYEISGELAQDFTLPSKATKKFKIDGNKTVQVQLYTGETTASKTEDTSKAIAHESYSTAYTPNKAFDENTAVYYMSKNAGTAVIGVDYVGYNFETPTVITALTHKSYSSSYNVANVLVQGSTDGITWTTIANITNLSATETTHKFANETAYTHYRILANGTVYTSNYQWAVSFLAFGTPDKRHRVIKDTDNIDVITEGSQVKIFNNSTAQYNLKVIIK